MTTTTTAFGVFTFQSIPFYVISVIIYMMVLFQATIIHGQDVDICACSPSSYRIQIDTSLTCDNNALTADFRKGLSEVNCDIDLGPTDIMVKSIKFTEKDQYGDIRKEREVSGDNLKKFAFKSDLPTSITDVPMSIEITLTAVSKDGKIKTNTNSFEFSNYCAGTPALQPGEGTGWVRFSSLGPPDSELCSNPL